MKLSSSNHKAYLVRTSCKSSLVYIVRSLPSSPLGLIWITRGSLVWGQGRQSKITPPPHILVWSIIWTRSSLYEVVMPPKNNSCNKVIYLLSEYCNNASKVVCSPASQPHQASMGGVTEMSACAIISVCFSSLATARSCTEDLFIKGNLEPDCFTLRNWALNLQS